MKEYMILAINPGSDSLRIALFKNEESIFNETIYYSSEDFSEINTASDELNSRINLVIKTLEKYKIPLSSIDAFAARAGGLTSLKSGVYLVNDTLIKHAQMGYSLKHASNLGVQIAHELAKFYKKQTYTVNPVTVDELQDVSRITGIHGIYRNSVFHALNQKEVAYQYSKIINKPYSELNLIIAHLGSGITVGAHKNGNVIDVNNALNGDGPFTTSRTGSIVASDLIDLCFSGNYTKNEIYDLVTKKGGLISLLGTNDVRKVLKLIENGNQKAKLVLDSMIYQISKQIGALSINFNGNLNAIILTGAISKSEYITEKIRKYVSFLGNIIIMPGELEMNALSNGVLRVLNNIETAHEYTGIPIDNRIHGILNR